jgi:glycosyl transferase, family 25
MLTCHSHEMPLEAACEATGEEALWGAVGLPAPSLRAFYLNLDQEVARRHSIEAQLAAAGMQAERIHAVDGSKPLPTQLSAYFNAEHLMDAGALGCYASHIKAWQKIVRKDLPYALVLEDDAILAPGLPQLLSDVLTALPGGWDMVHLGTAPDRAVCEVARVGTRRVVQFSRVPPGAVGYLLSRAGARKLLKAEPRLWPIDTDTRRPWLFGLAVYGVIAPPIKHNWSVPSTIRARGRKRWTPRRGLRAAFRNPIRNVQGMLFNWRRLGSARWSFCLCVNGALKLRAVLRRWVPSGLPALPGRRLQRLMHAAIEN